MRGKLKDTSSCWARKLVQPGFAMLLALLLTACSDGNLPPAPPTRPNPTDPPFTTAPATTSVSSAMNLPTPTTEVVALIPTAPPPVVPPTRFPTATPRPGQSVPEVGPSLTAVRTTKVSFRTAYDKAAARMSGVNGSARLVLAQLTDFNLERSVWTFFFTVPQGRSTWAVTYDAANPKDKKEVITVRSVALVLPEEAGQWQPARLLDSDEISARLERSGLPPDLPIDTVYVQQVTSTRQGRVPAYSFVNGTLNKQIIVNALTGDILQNDFV